MVTGNTDPTLQHDPQPRTRITSVTAVLAVVTESQAFGVSTMVRWLASEALEGDRSRVETPVTSRWRKGQ